MPESPYKFLDHYEYDPPGKDDRAIFFGRERETRILLADVLVSRLVVLFARTGTGKTSLINAGVRPRLEERDYKTFYIRVREDPIASARTELEKRLGLRLAGKTLAELIAEVAAHKSQESIVLFFDQFEEFFIYVRSESERGRRFIADVADLSLGPKSDIHIVFSMREEFFHEMNEFRDEIPSIFHNDSNLRLRWFDEEQAREAIVEPALLFGVRIDRDLEDRLIRDLKEDDRIEPAQLQIVCDTLWRETEAWRKAGEKRITLEHYNTLGRRGSRDTIAVQILYRRLEEMFQQLGSQPQLQVLYALLPKLRTPWNTKYVRDVLGLVKELTSDDPGLRDLIRDPAKLDHLVEQLKTDDRLLRDVIDRLTDVRFLRKGFRDDLEVVELSHDYLVPALEPLQQRVKVMALKRQIREAMEKSQAEGRGMAGRSLSDEDGDALLMSRPDFEAISDAAGLLNELTPEEAELLFKAALEHGIDLRTWFEKASSSGVAVWRILQERIEGADWQGEQADNALRLLGELKGARALELLESGVHHPDLATTALEVLGKVRSSEALGLLEKQLGDERLGDRALDILRRMRTPGAVKLLGKAARGGGPLALKAAFILDRVATARPEPDEVSRQAGKLLEELLRTQARSFFLSSLDHGQDMRFWFDRAMKSGVDVWRVLREEILQRAVPREKVENVIRLLSGLEDPEAEKLLRRASERLELSGLAQSALEDRAQKGERIRKQSLEIDDRLPKDPVSWERLIHAIQGGRCLPIIGSGLVPEFLPASEVARDWARSYRYPFPDADNLARVAQFVATELDPSFVKERMGEEIKRASPPDLDDVGEPHRILAELPLPVYVTTAYDDLMTQALQRRNKDPRRSHHDWRRLEGGAGSPETPPPTPGSPAVFHFYGTMDDPESMVLTEDDYLDFLTNIHERTAIPLPIQVALTRGVLLFLGYREGEIDLRILLRALLQMLRRNLTRAHQLVLLPPTAYSASEDQAILASASRYYANFSMRVYWGTSKGFLRELRDRWKDLS